MKQLNIPVADIVAKLKQVHKEGGNLLETIYQDDVWNVQVALTNGNGVFGALAFKAQFHYKNGKTGENIIQMNGVNAPIPGTVASQSNPGINIRKDLLEKMESIAKGFYTSEFKNIDTIDLMDRCIVCSALLRHFDELPDNFMVDISVGRTGIVEGKDLVQTDLASGSLQLNKAHEYSNKFIIEYRIKNSYLYILRDSLKELRNSGKAINADIREQIVKDIIAADLDLQKTIKVLIKDLKFILDAFAKANYGTTDLSRVSRFGDTTYGYVIYNKSRNEILYCKLSYKTGEKIGMASIQPNDYGILSCSETAMLLSSPVVNCKTSNAIIVASSKKVTNKVEWRNNFIARSLNDSKTEFRYKDVMTLPADQWERFIDLNDFVGNVVDDILKLVFMDQDGEETAVKYGLYIMEEILKKHGADTKTIDAAIGVALTDMLEINGQKAIAEVTTKRNGQKEIRINPQQSPQQSKKRNKTCLACSKDSYINKRLAGFTTCRSFIIHKTNVE